MSEELAVTEPITEPTPPPEPEAKPSLTDAGDKAFDKVEGKPTEEPKSAPKSADQVPTDNGNGQLTDEDKQALADVKAGKIIPKYRMDQILQKVKTYESFGTPEQFMEVLRENAELKKGAVKPSSTTTPELSPEDKEIRENLLRLFPHLANLDKTQDEFKQFRERIEQEKTEAYQSQETNYNGFISQAEESIKSMGKEAGLNIDDPVILDGLLQVVPRIINADETMRNKFYQGRDASVLKEAFSEFTKRFFSGIQRKTAADLVRDKKQQGNLPKPPVKGGAPSTGPEKTATSLEEAGDRAFEKVMAR